jgi:hypothetical protein
MKKTSQRSINNLRIVLYLASAASLLLAHPTSLSLPSAAAAAAHPLPLFACPTGES